MIISIGVSSLSIIVLIYNTKIILFKVYSALIGLQQLFITLEIMISFWINYSTVSLILKLFLKIIILIEVKFY